MTAKASGADVVRLFDPQQSTHYAMSEQTQFELDQVFKALDAIADLAEGLPGAPGAELEPHAYAPIFRSFSAYGLRLLADSPAVDRTGNRLRTDVL